MKIPVVLFVLMLLLMITSCSKEPEDTVARVGDEKITFAKFRESFALNPKYAIRTPMSKARKSQVEYLINEKYFYMAAEAVHLRADSVIQKKINYIKNQETIKTYLRETFLDQIEIGNEEIIQALAKIKKKVKLKHLFASTLAEAKVLQQRLKKGESFSRLANEVFEDPYLQASGGEIGFVGFGDLDPAIEDVAFNLPINQISEPVKSVYGYHLLKVTETATNENYLNMQMATQLDLVKRSLKNRKAADVILPHLKKLSGDRQIQVNNRALKMLVNTTRGVMGTRYTEQNLLKPPIRTGEIHSIELQLKDWFDMDLAKFGDKKFTIYSFLKRIEQMPPYHRPYLSGYNRIAQSVIDVIRDDLLLEDAVKNGFADDERVQQKSEEYIEELLADEFKKRYFSESFKVQNHEDWEQYHQALTDTKNSNPFRIFENNLFRDVTNPDSIITPPPIQIFLKNRYVW